MARIFDTVKIDKPKRNSFDLSHDRKFTLDMGNLVPILCQEVVPGDHLRLDSTFFLRMAPMTAPLMHHVNVYTHFFFVPNRLLWKGWEDFITGGRNGNLSPAYPTFHIYPETRQDLCADGSLYDYLGLPPIDPGFWDGPPGAGFPKFSQLPFRAYNLICNEYYRDQNLTEPEDFFFEEDGTADFDSYFNVQLRKRCWEKDYFTSALPWTQRGAEVSLPLTGSAPVVATDDGSYTLVSGLSGRPAGNYTLKAFHQRDSDPADYLMASNGTETNFVNIDPSGSLKADLSAVNSTTINELRRAFSAQKWLEKNARAGARYTEQILSHFGVKSSDARLQRPEYLGGGKSPITVSEVLQTSSTDDVTPQGNMSGHGQSVGNTHRFQRFFEEHGIVIGIMSVLPRTDYFQGIPRMFSKFDKFDYLWPEFAHLGEQPVLNQELYVDPFDPNYNSGTFGYQPRYTEYRYVPSSIHGDFRKTLNHWTMARSFSSRPYLNQKFVEADPTNRIFAYTGDEYRHLYVYLRHNLRALRPLPKYGTPSF